MPLKELEKGSLAMLPEIESFVKIFERHHHNPSEELSCKIVLEQRNIPINIMGHISQKECVVNR